MNKSTFTRKEIAILRASAHWEDGYNRIMAIRRRRTAMYAIAYGLFVASLWVWVGSWMLDLIRR